LLAGFGEDFGLDRETALSVGRAFGAGLGSGGICGALTGAYMLLGFKFHKEADQRQARYRTYDLVRKFNERFRARHATIICRELLGGLDLATRSGRQKATDRKLFSTVCPVFLRDAAEILEVLLGQRETP
jgi:C_GCAxxG_C_C family probable redox protein